MFKRFAFRADGAGEPILPLEMITKHVVSIALERGAARCSHSQFLDKEDKDLGLRRMRRIEKSPLKRQILPIIYICAELNA